ncbi:hypothetical protein P8935_24025 [Telmatobacter sp. DSM 110680]|uniref:Uncharacterized protein n=1 Tax=Telmatobacter sp. DSM 110680 TaxID=3036704 RepID=A0AAU7DJY1_9BACT
MKMIYKYDPKTPDAIYKAIEDAVREAIEKANTILDPRIFQFVGLECSKTIQVRKSDPCGEAIFPARAYVTELCVDGTKDIHTMDVFVMAQKIYKNTFELSVSCTAINSHYSVPD